LSNSRSTHIKNKESFRLLKDTTSEQMKLLIVIPTRGRSGVEEYALKIATAASKRWEVHAAIPNTKGTESLIEDFKATGITCHPFRIPETHFLAMKDEPLWKNISFTQDGPVLRGLHAFEKGVRRFKEVSQATVQIVRTVLLLVHIRPDAVVLNICWSTFGIGIILACGVLKIPTAVVFHLYPFPFVFHRLKANAYRWARARNQKWIAVSENNRKLISDSFRARPDEILRIYNGVKEGALSSDTDPMGNTELRRDVRRELGLSETALLLLTVARLDEQKGYDYLIPAIPHITREFEDVRYVWVGEGEQKDFLVERLKRYSVLDRVLLLGYRSDVPRLMKSADLFVFPTHYEGHPFTLLEAMANGLPIVTSDASGIPEIVEDKIHGVLSRAGDSCDLLEALRWALRHTERMQEMARNARKRVGDFREEQMVSETLAVLQTLGRSSNQR
jgi:glycosyltransferase involved in cell wall biosynthesis